VFERTAAEYHPNKRKMKKVGGHPKHSGPENKVGSCHNNRAREKTTARNQYTNGTPAQRSGSLDDPESKIEDLEPKCSF
jgi:hypothetical protein